MITAPTAAATYTATYAATGGGTCSDSFGYVCSTATAGVRHADTTVLALTGDDAVQQVTLPFPVKLYGQTYNTAWIDTNGLVSLVNPNGYKWDNTALPNPALANAAVYAFHDDLVIDGSASVRTTTDRHRAQPPVRGRVAQRLHLRRSPVPADHLRGDPVRER